MSAISAEEASCVGGVHEDGRGIIWIIFLMGHDRRMSCSVELNFRKMGAGLTNQIIALVSGILMTEGLGRGVLYVDGFYRQ